MSSSAATARVAASSAARRSARPWTSARDQAASTASSRSRTTGSTAPVRRVEDQPAERLVAVVRAERERREARAGVLGRHGGERARPRRRGAAAAAR